MDGFWVKCIAESILLQLHRDLLRYSEKANHHQGQWKTLDNHVADFDAEGKQVGIMFETATPFETPMLMEKLLGWHVKEEAVPILHPLLRIAVFNVVFLAIHPFQPPPAFRGEVSLSEPPRIVSFQIEYAMMPASNSPSPMRFPRRLKENNSNAQSPWF